MNSLWFGEPYFGCQRGHEGTRYRRLRWLDSCAFHRQLLVQCGDELFKGELEDSNLGSHDGRSDPWGQSGNRGYGCRPYMRKRPIRPAPDTNTSGRPPTYVGSLSRLFSRVEPPAFMILFLLPTNREATIRVTYSVRDGKPYPRLGWCDLLRLLPGSPDRMISISVCR